MPTSGFLQRGITAIIFAIVVIGLILGGKTTTYALLSIIGVTCAFEYEKTVHGRYLGIYGVSVGLIFVVIQYLPREQYPIFLILSVLLALLLITGVFKAERFLDHTRYGSIINIFYIAIPLGIFAKEIQGMIDPKTLVLGLIFLVWLSDTGAYIVGSQIGKTKLLPRVSPKKTVEGFLGACALTMVGAILIGKYTYVRPFYWWIAVGLIVWLFGSMGDLVQSSIKRKFGIKDSGSLLPGHGGFWDRFDSFILLVPFVLLLDYYWNN